MIKKTVREEYVKAPWGKIALVSWGESSNPPVLLVHGYMDTAATFNLLVDQLPHTHYYVAFDIPGHGKSDPFPPGIIVTQLHVVEVIKRVIEHLNWKRFTYMSHSMSCIIGLFYHHIYPDYIKKMILLDITLPLEMYYVSDKKQSLWFQALYADYYNNFQKLSWEPRMKKIAQLPMPEETLYTIMTENIPPTLSIDASESLLGGTASKRFAENLLQKCEQTLPHFYRTTVEGGHDVHITSPELLVPHINKFLKSSDKNYTRFFKKKCKL